MVITTIPYLIAFQMGLPQREVIPWRFSGFLFGVEDGNSYIAKMRRGMEGEWFFRSPYSSMEQTGLLAFFPYYLLGKLAGGDASHEQLAVLYHWFRIGAGVLNILATYVFICSVLTQRIWRQVALVLVTLGGGLGWLVLLFPTFQGLPLEFYSPEAFGFLSLYGLPHLSLARAFMLLGLNEYLGFWSHHLGLNKTAHSWRLGFYCLGAGLSQPIHAALLGILITIHFMVVGIGKFLQKSPTLDWQVIRRNILFVSISTLPALVLVAYTAVRFFADPYLRIWAAQNRLPAAPVSLYLLSYGWLIPLALGGLIRILKNDDEKCLLLLVWIGVAIALIFTPVSIQRRLIEGVWVAVILLSLLFLESLDGMRRRPIWMWGGILVLYICALPSALLLIWGGVQSALSPKIPIFIPERDAIGYEALNRFEKSRDAVVLAAYETSNALPAYAFVRVIIGHGPESANGDQLVEQVKVFYQEQTSNAFRWDFIRQHRIQYVVWGENEKKLGDWKPILESYLEPVYRDEDLAIFEVDWTKLED